MLVIRTRFLGSTKKHGPRMRAISGLGSITIPYPEEAQTIDQAHEIAARANWNEDEEHAQCFPIVTLLGAYLGKDMYWIASANPPELGNKIKPED